MQFRHQSQRSEADFLLPLVAKLDEGTSIAQMLSRPRLAKADRGKQQERMSTKLRAVNKLALLQRAAENSGLNAHNRCSASDGPLAAILGGDAAAPQHCANSAKSLGRSR
jgi:hypothetical protein